MKRPDDLPEWKDADRISDQIIDLANREVKQGISPLQVFAGVMLGLMGIMRSAPSERPQSMLIVEAALSLCLHSIMDAKKKEN